MLQRSCWILFLPDSVGTKRVLPKKRKRGLENPPRREKKASLPSVAFHRPTGRTCSISSWSSNETNPKNPPRSLRPRRSFCNGDRGSIPRESNLRTQRPLPPRTRATTTISGTRCGPMTTTTKRREWIPRYSQTVSRRRKETPNDRETRRSRTPSERDGRSRCIVPSWHPCWKSVPQTATPTTAATLSKAATRPSLHRSRNTLARSDPPLSMFLSRRSATVCTIWATAFLS
mmetsp:Transcript_13299/g.27872  ORF Transcript_13299/g.27872 Transcript_13299/m.27872 type:complete len:231 (+) Transcript_13299:367-1059(+)